MKHPKQKKITAEDGIFRYTKNAIVAMLVNSHEGIVKGGLNDLCARTLRGEFTFEDYNQILQQVGYSVSGYEDARLSKSGR